MFRKNTIHNVETDIQPNFCRIKESMTLAIFLYSYQHKNTSKEKKIKIQTQFIFSRCQRPCKRTLDQEFFNMSIMIVTTYIKSNFYFQYSKLKTKTDPSSVEHRHSSFKTFKAVSTSSESVPSGCPHNSLIETPSELTQWTFRLIWSTTKQDPSWKSVMPRGFFKCSAVKE